MKHKWQMELNRQPRNKHSHMWSVFSGHQVHSSWKEVINSLCWENWISTHRRMKLDLYLVPCTKNNKVDLNMGAKTLFNSWKKTYGKNFMTLNLAMISWLWQRHRQQKTNWTSWKFKTFVHQRTLSTKYFSKILTNHLTDKDESII